MTDVRKQDLVVAERLGTQVSYGRRTVARSRDERILDMVSTHGSVSVGTVAKALKVSDGAARHALWRLSGGEAKGERWYPAKLVRLPRGKQSIWTLVSPVFSTS